LRASNDTNILSIPVNKGEKGNKTKSILNENTKYAVVYS
jgi:hypothetical protein